MRDDSSNIPSGEGPPADDVSTPMKLPNDLQDFARRLTSFEATSPSSNREALIFAAGQAAASRERLPRRYGLWQASTALMTCTSLALGAAILVRPEPEPRIVVVDRVQAHSQEPQGPPEAVPDSPHSSEPIVVDVDPSLEDAQLGEAWRLRQELIAQGNNPDNRLAIVHANSAAGTPTRSLEKPLTRASFLGERSQETIHRWLKDQL